VSTPPWRGLNLALHVGDDPDAVAANRAELASRLGAGALSFPEQTHGAGVHILTAGGPVPSPRGVPGVDALVTAVPRVPLGVLVADCVPVLFADPVARVIAVAHAGRRGLVAGVLGATVDAMSRLGADPARMTAVIGPAVCGRCYEVPGGLQAAVAAAIPGTETTTRAGTPALDLPAGARSILSRLGVAAVRTVEACTVEDDRFYSYRRDGETGRFAGVVMLAGDD
jgi:hypothetical protein